MNKKLSSLVVFGLFFVAMSACSHKSSLAMSRNNISVSTKSFDGKNVGLDLSGQADVLNTKMGGASFQFDNAKKTVSSVLTASLKDKAKSVKEGKGDITVKPLLTLDVVNDYFTKGCVAKVDLALLNSKGEQIKAVSKNFKRTYVMDWGYKDACNEATTEVIALALSSL